MFVHIVNCNVCRVDVPLRTTKYTARHTKRLTNNSYLSQTLAIQTRQTQLQRQSLQLERRKVAALEAIAGDLATLRAAYNAVHEITFIEPRSSFTDAEFWRHSSCFQTFAQTCPLMLLLVYGIWFSVCFHCYQNLISSYINAFIFTS